MKVSTCVLLLAALAAIGCGIDYFWTQKIIFQTRESNAGRIHRLYVSTEDEVPIFGSSKAAWDYVPTEISPVGFNYGIHAGFLPVTNAMLAVELAKARTCPVIVDVQIVGYSWTGDVCNYIPFAMQPEFAGLLQRQGLMEWRYRVPGLRYFGYYDYYLKDLMAEKFDKGPRMARGYAVIPIADPAAHRIEFQKMAEIQAGRDYGYTADTDEDNRLIDLIRTHPQRPIILVYAPYHASCFARFQHADQFEAFKAKLAALPNVQLVDWSRRPYPDEDFVDPIHLDPQGARQFSHDLREELHRRYAGRPEERYFPAEEVAR